jgi:hypothetical protein
MPRFIEQSPYAAAYIMCDVWTYVFLSNSLQCLSGQTSLLFNQDVHNTWFHFTCGPHAIRNIHMFTW